MKKRKITYSLTAQQKKKLKQGEPKEAQKSEQQQEGEEVAASRNSNKTLIICITALVLAVVLIVLAIFIPIWTAAENITNETFTNWANFNPKDPDNPFTEENPNPNPPSNPIATITLKGANEEEFKRVFGDTKVIINLEIFMDRAAYAGMNFMYLSESGFYDNTVINHIYRGSAMFCGFTDIKNNQNRALESNFILRLKGFNEHTVSTSGNDNFKLGYRLDRENEKETGEGYLVMIAGSNSYYGTSTAFMLTTAPDPQFNYADETQPINSYISWLGKANDEESLNLIRKFNSVLVMESGDFYCPQSNIIIESIKTNLSSAKKNYLLNNFEELISGKTSTWREVAFNQRYYEFAG